MTEQQLTQEEQDTIIATIIEEFYSIDAAEAIMVRTVIEDLGGEDLAKIINDARMGAVEKWGEDPGIGAKIKEAVEGTLLNYGLKVPDRYYAYYRIECGNKTFAFTTHDHAETLAKERIDNMIDEGVVSQETIVDSWTRGQSREEWVEEVFRYDGMGSILSSYDGNYEERMIDGELWVYWRES